MATRKCYIKRSTANATRKLATKRRKTVQEYLAFYKSTHQTLLDIVHTLFLQMKSNKKLFGTLDKSGLGKALKMAANPDTVAKQLLVSYPVQEQSLLYPPMSKQQELHLIQSVEKRMEKTKEAMKTLRKKLPKTLKVVPYKNPYKVEGTRMPDLYVGSGECVWESDDVDSLYKKRLSAIKDIQHTFQQYKKLTEKLAFAKASDLHEQVKEHMEQLQTLPPGPTKEAEQERIVYITYYNQYFKVIFAGIKDFFDDLKTVLKKLKKKQ
jgi:hypothetical protein